MKSIDQALLASLDLVFAQKADGRLIYISDVTARAFGGDRTALTNQPLTHTTLPGNVVKELAISHQEILASGRPTVGQIELGVDYLDTQRCYEYTFSPVRGRSGEIDATVFIAKDITERRQAELALRDSESKYRTLFESASDIILILDINSYRVLNANWAAARKLGYSRLDLMKLSLQEIEASFDPERQYQLTDALEIDGNIIYEHTYQRKQGTTFPVEINAQLIEYEEQLCIQSFVRDITERKQAEDKIRRQQQQIASIAANFPGTLYRKIVHRDGTISMPYVSEGKHRFTGVQSDEIRNDPTLLQQFVHPGDRAYRETELHRCQQTLDPLDIEYRNIHSDGTTFWLRELAHFYGSDTGDVVADGCALDITEQKGAQLALERQLEQERLLRQITTQIHQSLDLSTILQTAVDTALDYFQVERVVVKRRLHDQTCQISTQAISREELRIDVTQVPDMACNYIEMLQSNHPLVINNIYQSDFSPEFIEFLEQFHVRSLVAVPILTPSSLEHDSHSNQLWGMLCFHEYSQPREWLSTDVELMQQIAIQLGIAIHQSELHHQVQIQLQERIRAEEEVRSLNHELRALNAALEQRVQERTQELQTANDQLATEIKERAWAMIELEKSEQRFRDLVESTNDLIWEEDSRGIILYMSPQSMDILGYAPDELIGKSCFDLVVPEQHNLLQAIFAAERAGQTRSRCELTMIRKDGYTIVVDSSSVSRFDGQGRYIGSKGIDRDVTELKRTEQALRESESQFQQIFDNIDDVFFLKDKSSGKILYQNVSSNQVFQYPDADAYHNPDDIAYNNPDAWLQCVHPDDYDRISAEA
ncbi:MAG: PAS domain S-box protein, partial [Cyanobacteria bacterium J06633_2]